MRHTVMKTLILGVLLSALPVLASTPDGLITSKTKLSLWTTGGVRSTSVHVDTDDGVVTLHGKVPTAEQRALAEKAAREIVGVRDVRNLLQVVAEAEEKRVAHSDKDLLGLSEKRLKADPALRDSSISVKSVDNGVVLLSGEAKTFSDLLRAITIVDRVPGVRRVASEIRGPDGFSGDERVMHLRRTTEKRLIEAKGAEVVSSAADMRISAAVKLRLLTAAQVPSTEISVDTEDRVVTLFGMVPTAEVKKAAAAEAGKVDGVARVLNQLEVVPSALKQMVEAKDADISRDLALAFKDRAEFKGVEIAVKNGTVQLTGTVASGWDEVSAVRTARKVAGVRGVEDQLKVDEKVSPESTRRD